MKRRAALWRYRWWYWLDGASRWDRLRAVAHGRAWNAYGDWLRRGGAAAIDRRGGWGA
jgi:hypothetical protein